MPPKTAGTRFPPPAKLAPGRTAFVATLKDASDLTPAHVLQLAGLAPAAGFPLGSGRTGPPEPLAGEKGKKGGAGKGKSGAAEGEIIEVLSTDDELDLLGPSGSGGARRRTQHRPPKEHSCSKIRCAANPNCLAWLGADKWDDDDKAREAFVKKALPGQNPLNLARDPGVPCGLRLGATCYAAALLQTWCHNVDFRNLIYSLMPDAEIDLIEFRKTPLYQLQKVFHGLEASSQSSFDPKGLVEALELEQGEQQDAQEFSKLFLDLISKAANKDAVEGQFGGSMQYVTKCKGCKYESRRTSSFTEIDLSIEAGGTVETLLQKLIKHEVLSGDNKYDCPGCESYQDAVRYMELNTLPPTLNLSVLRFVYDPEANERIKTKKVVKFPPTLDMGKFVCGGTDNESMVYDLRAVLVHKGESAYSGHYCAQIHNAEDNKWYECDDESVVEIKPLTPTTASPPRTNSIASSSALDARRGITKRHESPIEDLSPPPMSSREPAVTVKTNRSFSIEDVLDRDFGTKTSSPAREHSDLPPPPRKKIKSSVLPWAPQKPVSRPVESDEHEIIVEPRSAGWVPSFKPLVPEHRHDVRSSLERSSATLSHAQVGSSQQTYSHKGSSPLKGTSPAKMDYQSSKDAYMLVYQRRERPDKPATAPPPQPAPAYVQQEIRALNAQWEGTCTVYEHQQEAVTAAFNEVKQAKRAVFREWKVRSFDEPAYILQADEVEAWVEQGLWVKPKKNEKGAGKQAEKESPKESEKTAENDKDDGDVARDSPKASANGCSSAADCSVPMDVDKNVKPTLVEPEPVVESVLKLSAEDVPPALLEDRAATAEAKDLLRQQVRDAAVVRDFSTRELCRHGKVDPLQPMTFKRVSADVVERLLSLGCTIDTASASASADLLCIDCARLFFAVQLGRQQHIKHQDTFKRYDALPGCPSYLVSKAWIRAFKAPLPKDPFAPHFSDPPSAEEYLSDVVCEHGGLPPKRGTNATTSQLSPQAYEYLQQIFPGFEAPADDAEVCEACRLECLPSQAKADDEKRNLKNLVKRCSPSGGLFADKRKHLIGNLVIVDTEFLKAWYLWIENPGYYARPTFVDTAHFICEHGDTLLDLTNRRELDDATFSWVREEEWAVLESIYDHGPRITATCLDTHPHDTLVYEWSMSIPTCHGCRRTIKRDYVNGLIVIAVTKSEDVLHDLLDPVDVPLRDDLVLLNGSPVRPNLKLPSGVRSSKRKRGAFQEKADRQLYDVEITPSDTIRSIKVALAETLGTSALYLTLYKGSQVCDNASSTVQDLDIIPGDYLYALQQEAPDEDEQELMALSGVSVKHSRRSPHDDGGGFSNTLLGSAGGHSSKPSSRSKLSSSASSTLMSDSPEPAPRSSNDSAIKGKDQKPPFDVDAIGRALEAGETVGEAEMEAFFAAQQKDEVSFAGLLDDEPAFTGNRCPACTFVNEPDVDQCSMCGKVAFFDQRSKRWILSKTNDN